MKIIFTILLFTIMTLTASGIYAGNMSWNDGNGNSGNPDGKTESTSVSKNTLNPSSKVCYSIAAATGVRITVFDLFAREVATVVNEFQQPGNYEADLNNFNLSAGTYYYKIQTGDNTSVKKIIIN